MDDLISRQTALDGLMLCDFAQDSRQYGGATVLFESSVRKMLEQIPAVQIVKQTELTEECIQKIANAVADELERRREE